jgi:lactate dehydrogenase-like 2-hydroxyacid dehydrogenase
MDILFQDNPTLPMKRLLEDNNCIAYKPGNENPLNVECIYTHRTPIVKEDYPKLRYIICPMTGVMHLGNVSAYELFYLDKKQWLYDNVWSTAEHTFSLMIRIMRGLNREIRGKTVGIFGFGRVGQQLYKLLKGWGCNVIWYDNKEIYYDVIEGGNKVKYVEDLFLEADIISVHLPENSLTHQMINTKLLSICTMQPIIINTARASIVNYINLVEAFESGKIAGFGMDIDFEYVQKESPHTWITLENLARVYKGAILTDHIAGKSIESRIATDKFVVNNFFSTLGGKLYEDNIGLL